MGGGSESESSNLEGRVTVNIRCTNGSKFSLQVKLDETVGSFKVVLAKNCDIPAEQQKLIYRGRILKDDQTLESYESGQTGGAAGGFDMNTLINMFAGLGAGGLAPPNRSNVPPEELYATQLAQLQEMGFFDTRENLQALTATSGNVHAAVERLLGNLGQQ